MQHEGSENDIDVDRQGFSGVNDPSSSTLKRPRSALDLASPKRPPPETILKIISATYGPSEGRRLLTGELSNDGPGSIPFTRDVAPFLKALLMARKVQGGEQSKDVDEMEEDSAMTSSDLVDDDLLDLVRISGLKRHTIPLMDGKQMNAIFGDPCPGTSKRLSIHYVAYEAINGMPARASSASEVHRVSFVEHERVVLRTGLALYQDDTTLQNAVAAAASKLERTRITEESEDNQEVMTLRNARKMGRAQSIAEFAESLTRNDSPLLSTTAKKWRLRSATSEVTLPIILPFLEVKERVQCKLVCLVWRNVIRYWGVAKTVDVNDDTTFPNFTAPILRGLLAHSHHSLQSLFLGDFQELTKQDLHPAIPHLRKLKNLDISRCNNLDDSTLHLLSEHVSTSLEVLYLKGLQHVTDKGIIAISLTCSDLQVLEVSNVRITDESGIAIGENLLKLKALYMRDNYLLTNRSVDVITENCAQLSQLTLWGCMRLRHLSFHTVENDIGCGKLVLLNLWGCHSLVDEVANSLGAMTNLRSLIVSECHKLTNVFLSGVAQNVPQLNHLHLRYCKKITDKGINIVANSMQCLHSLDLSFCSRVTSTAIHDLLVIRQNTLAELRLQNCTQLDITRDLRHHSEFRGNFTGDGNTGRSILNTLRSEETQSHLSMIDLRNCGGHQEGQGYPNDDAFVQGMAALRFKQLIPGFFQRPSRLRLYAAVQEDLEG